MLRMREQAKGSRLKWGGRFFFSFEDPALTAGFFYVDFWPLADVQIRPFPGT